MGIKTVFNGDVIKLLETEDCEYWGYAVEKKKEKVKPENPFEFVAVDAKKRDDIRHIKNVLYDLYCWILDNVQENKYRSNGIDLLESAAMQLNKAISRRDGNDRQPQSK